jgi:prophage DNA circulation protein
MLGSVSEYINEQANLPSSTTITFSEQVPALVLAEDFYGDAGRTEELYTRNKIRNPLFCNTEMEILSQ